MTAKPRQTAGDGIPGQPGSLMGALQQEVADEASPMLLFLSRHARSIVVLIVLFIAVIAGFWIYEGQAEKKRGSEVLSLGRLMLISDSRTRLERLEAFAATAPDSVRNEVWFAMMEAASQVKDYSKAYEAWKRIGDIDKSVRITAAVGMADALSAQEKYKEALDLLNGVASGLKDSEISLVNSRIVLLAENLGDYSRAMTACDILLSKPGSRTDMALWAQKKAVLEQKAAASPGKP